LLLAVALRARFWVSKLLTTIQAVTLPELSEDSKKDNEIKMSPNPLKTDSGVEMNNATSPEDENTLDVNKEDYDSVLAVQKAKLDKIDTPVLPKEDNQPTTPSLPADS